MEIGDYVRFDGEIAKIRDIKRYKTKEDIYFFDRILDLNEDRSCNDNTIYNSQWKYFDNVKSSPNIIDLIEEGDYVNGSKVIKIEEYNDEKYIYVEEMEFCNACNEDENVYYKEDTINSILTKEQFEAIKYEVK